MSARHLDALRIDSERVESAQRFLVSYADLCVRELADLDAGNAKYGPRERNSGRDRQLDDKDRPGWGLRAEAASSYFEAGEWAMLTNPKRALELWARAGALYRELRFGFGYYLFVTTGAERSDSHGDAPNDVITQRLWRSIDNVIAASKLVDSKANATEPAVLTEALRHPQQQTYLVLAGASLAGASLAGNARNGGYPGPLGDRFYSLIVRSRHYEGGGTPVGALGIPSRLMWQVAAMMLQPKDDSVARIADVIIWVARRYDDSIQQAMVNSYLWRNAAAPVDVGSFDIAALTINAFRVFGQYAVLDALGPRMEAETTLARGQIEIAIEVASANNGDNPSRYDHKEPHR